VRVIGEHCFESCSELMEVHFESPPTIHTIQSYAFSGCSGLTDFTVPSSVSTLGDGVFCFCSELSSVIFETPSRLTEIPAGIFQGCYLLKSLHLPDSVQTIGGSVFERSGITSVAGANCLMCGFLFVHFQTAVRCFGEPSNIKIPCTVRDIGARAFYSVYSMRDLSFEEGTVRIGASAFMF
jgi:hypothetical protein